MAFSAVVAVVLPAVLNQAVGATCQSYKCSFDIRVDLHVIIIYPNECHLPWLLQRDYALCTILDVLLQVIVIFRMYSVRNNLMLCVFLRVFDAVH